MGAGGEGRTGLRHVLRVRPAAGGGRFERPTAGSSSSSSSRRSHSRQQQQQRVAAVSLQLQPGLSVRVAAVGRWAAQLGLLLEGLLH